MTEGTFIDKYGFWALVAYVLLKDGLPILSKFLSQLTETYFPSKVKERQQEMAHKEELEERQLDLREREVAAMENIAKSLAVIDTRVQSVKHKLDLTTTSLITANQALAIIMDRTARKREDFQPPAAD